MRRITNFNHLVAMVAVFTTVMAVSCMRDEVVDTPFYGSESDVICFGVNDVHFADDEITRGEGAERLGKRDLCSEQGDFSLPMGIYQQKGIESLYAEGTRGSMFTKEQLNTMRIWGTFTPASGDAFTYINGDTYTKQANEEFTTPEVYLWPGSGTLKFDAFANLPDNVTINNENSVVTSITYTAPTNVANQKDIIYASASVSGDYGQAVPLTFEHILSAVNFKVGDIAHGTIKSITLKGVYNTGIYNFSNGQWAILNQNNSHKSNYSVPLAGGQFNVDGNTASETFINDQRTGILFMIPQIVGEGATVEVVFAAPGANDRVLTASIAGDDWGKDIVTNYTISIDEQYNLNITPVGKLLDAHYIIAQVEVTVEGMNDGGNVSNPNKWQLTAGVKGDTSVEVTLVTNDCIAEEEKLRANNHATELSMIQQGFWCDEYVSSRTLVDNSYVYTTNGVSARGTSAITGIGNITKTLVYVLIPENNSNASREITLTLQKVNDSNVTKSVVLTQRCPGWTGSGTGAYGWETVDDNEDSKYGYTFTRRVGYVFVYGCGKLTDRFKTLGWNWTKDYTVNYIFNNFVNPYGGEKIASDKWYSYNLTDNRLYVYLDYTLLNNLENVNSTTEGLTNTLNLFDFAGTAATSQVEIVLDNVYKWEDGHQDEKAFRLSDGVTNNEPNDDTLRPGEDGDLSGILNYVLRKNKYNLYDINDGTFTSAVPVINRADIKWYLPADGQFSTFTPNPNITDPAGGTDSADDYWSSRAGSNNTDPNLATSYNGSSQEILRSKTLGVIAVRDWDGDTKTATATISEISTEEMKGGENGEAQWVE